MHVALITLILATGADITGGGTSACSNCDGGSYGVGGDTGYGYGFMAKMRAKMGPMPQTCYSQRYGCYPGNTRDMHRYPAFHGHYYSNPYHYRNTFDYPWHADLHEPTSHFSYNASTQGPSRQSPDVAPLPPQGARARGNTRSAQRPASPRGTVARSNARSAQPPSVRR